MKKGPSGLATLVGEGNEIAHIDLIMGPRGSAAEKAFANSLTNNKRLHVSTGGDSPEPDGQAGNRNVQ
jgi:hypothetical protein